MTLTGIPRSLIERAASLPENEHARGTLLRAAGASQDPESHPASSKAFQEAQNVTSGVRKGKRRGTMNRTEQRFADDVLSALVLAGEIDRWEYEALTLRIPNVGAITPDFVGYRDNQIRVLFEVKGRVAHEASVLRMKAHAAARPWWRWMIWKRKNGVWVRHFDSGGTWLLHIPREVIILPDRC